MNFKAMQTRHAAGCEEGLKAARGPIRGHLKSRFPRLFAYYVQQAKGGGLMSHCQMPQAANLMSTAFIAGGRLG
jgi:hypothetical protein